MTLSQPNSLPESVAVALADAVADIASATVKTIPIVIGPLVDAWLDAVEEFETVDCFEIYDAIPPLPADVADAAEAIFESAEADARSLMPIMLAFVDMKPVCVLSGLRVLSFEAGKGADDYDAWRNEAITALWIALRLPEGQMPSRISSILGALEDAFFDGREAGGITCDPPRRVSKFTTARIAAARDMVPTRLVDADDLDDLADSLAADFKIQPGDAWLAVEEVSRAAAVDGDLHAARLRSAQILGTHKWFVEHADKMEERRTLTVGAMIARDRARSVLAQVAA